MDNLASTNIYNFNPDEVMRRLATGDWTGCWAYLAQMLDSLNVAVNAYANIALQKEFQDTDRKAFVTNFGGMVGELVLALLCDPTSKLSDKDFGTLMFYHETFHALLYLNNMDNTDAIVMALVQGKKTLSDSEQKRILMLLSLNTDLDIVGLIKKTDPKYRVPAVTAYFSYQKVFDAKIYANKIRLYALRHDLEKTHDDFKTLSSALISYFNCSYLDIPNRHDIKININQAVKKYLAKRQKDFKRIQSNAPLILDVVLDEKKPTLLVIIEAFAKGHAMNRGWGEWVRALESEFSLVMAIPQEKFDTELRKDFRNIVTFSNIGEFVHTCYTLKPDVVVLPSVGMFFYGIVAANMRIAPMQLMGLGHPATSMSDEIDFVYGQSRLYDAPAFPKDRYIADDSPCRFGANLTKEQVMAIHPPKRQANDTKPLRVMVVGSNLKISYPFLKLLQEIESESPHPIHFEFHLGTVGIDSLYIEKILKPMFKDFAYHGWQPYAEYFESLQNADIVLNPFPFGHTNTIIDTLLLGKPCVGMEQSEPSTRTEGYVLEICGFGDEFTARSIPEYKEKFRTLSGKILRGEEIKIDREKVYDALYGIENATDFGKVLKWVYDNRKALKSKPPQMFRVFQDAESTI